MTVEEIDAICTRVLEDAVGTAEKLAEMDLHLVLTREQRQRLLIAASAIKAQLMRRSRESRTVPHGQA